MVEIPEFIEHISKYIGSNVTIYTSSGKRLGFTGELLSCNPCFVRLDICMQRPLRRIRRIFFFWRSRKPSKSKAANHKIVDIPADKIVGFVHAPRRGV